MRLRSHGPMSWARPPFSDQVRWLTWAFLLIFALGLLLAFLWSAKWVALISGFVGSLALVVPPARVELMKQGRERLRSAHLALPDLQAVGKELGDQFTRSIDQWHFWDSFMIFLGATLLALSFLLQIVAELFTP